jgi:hypothetical protein
MGKFYVLIQLSGKTYKLCRDDVKLVYSRQRIGKPALPAFALRRIPSRTTLDASDQEESSLQFEPIEFSKHSFQRNEQV